MAAFLESILSVMGAAVAFLVNLIKGFIQLIEMIPAALSMVSFAITSMPPVLAVFMTAFISVSVVYLVIGR